MNQFKVLDTLFPCGPQRLSGEVVGVTVRFTPLNKDAQKVFFSKRKAWYVNASVNAFHLHRDLCKDLRCASGVLDIRQPDLKALKRVLGRVVLFAYMRNHTWEEQYHEFDIVETVKGCYVTTYTLDPVTGDKLCYNHLANLWVPSWNLVPFSFATDWVQGVEVDESLKALQPIWENGPVVSKRQ